MTRDRPPRAVLVGLVAIALLQPLVARAVGTPVGRYSMFMRIERYHLDLFVRTPAGERPIAVRTLRPHLYRESWGILLPAEGTAVGADQVDLVEDGLGDIAVLLCRLYPDAASARVRFLRGRMREPLRVHEVTEACASVR